jgi:hypothetical protein
VTPDHTPERLGWHMHVSSGLICRMTHLAPDAEPTVPVHILTDDELAALRAGRDQGKPSSKRPRSGQRGSEAGCYS